MEITKRELIASISILAIFLLIGLFISNIISDKIYDTNEVYYKALKIEDSDTFKYGMKTNVGNAFVYGELKALDTVSYPDIPGEYMYIEKVKERYTKHTRTVTYKDSNGKTKTRTETYWTWDVVGRDSKSAENVNFLGVDFKFNQFSRPSDRYLDTKHESSNVRYKYYGVASTLKGTIFTSLKDNNIGTGNYLYEGKDLKSTLEYMEETNMWLWLFWIVWTTLTWWIMYWFCIQENDWLNY